MKVVRVFIVLFWVTALCNAGVIGRADEVLLAKVPISVINKGKSKLPDREIVIEDYEVTITNNTGKEVYLSCSTPKYHSAYIKKRNPLTICYDTSGEKGSRNLSGRGLSGNGSLISIKPQKSLRFTVPMPTLKTDKESGKFRIMLVIYLDEKLTQGRIFYSEPLEHNKKDKQE